MPDEMPPAPIETGIHCSDCGYDLSGTAVGGVCPECGLSVRNSLATWVRHHRPRRTSSFSVGSFVTALGCIVIFPLAPVFGAVALVLGWLAVREMWLRHDDFTYASHWMATVGLAVGALTVGFGLLFLLFALAGV